MVRRNSKESPSHRRVQEFTELETVSVTNLYLIPGPALGRNQIYDADSHGDHQGWKSPGNRRQHSRASTLVEEGGAARPAFVPREWAPRGPFPHRWQGIGFWRPDAPVRWEKGTRVGKLVSSRPVNCFQQEQSIPEKLMETPRPRTGRDSTPQLNGAEKPERSGKTR